MVQKCSTDCTNVQRKMFPILGLIHGTVQYTILVFDEIKVTILWGGGGDNNRTVFNGNDIHL